MAPERKLGNEHFKDARELILSGATKTDLCEYFSVTYDTLAAFLKRHNLECNPTRYKCPSWLVAALLNWGYSRADLAQALGVSIPTAIKRSKEVISEIESFGYRTLPASPSRVEIHAQRLAEIVTPKVVLEEPKRLFQVTIPQIEAKFAVMASNQEEALAYIKGIVKIEEVAPLRSATP